VEDAFNSLGQKETGRLGREI